MAQQASPSHNREVLERMQHIITVRDYDALPEVLHPDFVQVLAQSGERVVGIANFRKVLENIPGEGPGVSIEDDPYVVGEAAHYMMTPTFNVVKVEGSGADELTSYAKAKYPDGSYWYIISFTSFRDGLIVKRVDFFAPLLDPPPWRAEWVERI